MRRHTISFQNAAQGILTATHSQTNIRFHLASTIAVFLLSVYLRISLVEGLVLILTVTGVFDAEMFNTAIEFLADAVTLEDNDQIRHAKDISAGAVLFAAVLAAAVGGLIFIPKLIALL
jgi:diacylglycerol kinase (ATP)